MRLVTRPLLFLLSRQLEGFLSPLHLLNRLLRLNWVVLLHLPMEELRRYCMFPLGLLVVDFFIKIKVLLVKSLQLLT